MLPAVSAPVPWIGVGGVGVNLRIRRGNGYDGPVSLDVTGLPEGVTASSDRDVLPGLADLTARLTLTAASDAKPWTGTVTIRGVASRSDAHCAAQADRDRRQDRAVGQRTHPRDPTGRQIATDVTVKVSFPSTDGGTGIARTAAAERVDGVWRTISLTGATAMSAVRRLAFHHAYLHRRP